jgi:hypothetical protein
MSASGASDRAAGRAEGAAEGEGATTGRVAQPVKATAMMAAASLLEEFIRRS